MAPAHKEEICFLSTKKSGFLKLSSGENQIVFLFVCKKSSSFFPSGGGKRGGFEDLEQRTGGKERKGVKKRSSR